MKLRRYNSKDQLLWDTFLDSAKNGHFMFKRDYMEYHADRFKDHSLIVMDERERIIALLPANEYENKLYTHQGLTFGGFITDAKMRTAIMVELISLLKRYANDHRFSEIVYKTIPVFYHLCPACEDFYALLQAGAKLYRCDVSSTIDYAHPIKFSTLRRRGIKRATQKKLEVRENLDLATYFALLNDVLVKHSTAAVHTADEMTSLHNRFPQNIRLFSTYLRDEMVAGVLIYETETVAHAQYIAGLPEYQNIGALDLVFDYLINKEYANKRYFDFGISTENEGKHLNVGLINQKEGFGARATAYCTFKLDV